MTDLAQLPWSCGSGNKYKKCCLDADEAKGGIF